MLVFATLLCVWLLLNLFVTRRVSAAARLLYLPRRMLIGTIWCLPFLGALIALMNTPSPRVAKSVAADAEYRDRSHEYGEPPDVLTHPHTGEVFAVGDHLRWINGIPLLDWRALDAWATGTQTPAVPDTQRCMALEQGRRAWLLHLRLAFGAHMGLFATDAAHVLSSLNERQERATADYVRTAKTRITKLLGDLARFPVDQRSVVLVMDNEEDYYRYVSLYYPDGEFAVSGGLFIDEGCPHFVVVRAHLQFIEPVIAHELTHSALAHLRLPRWLDEGIAVNSERRVAGPQPSLHTPHELHAMHRAHWNAQKVQRLWSGESFFRSDDDTLLSYELARIIVEQMARQWEHFAAFVRAAAHAQDAGASAAQSVLAVDLGAYAAVLVQAPSDEGWAPRPDAWPSQTPT